MSIPKYRSLFKLEKGHGFFSERLSGGLRYFRMLETCESRPSAGDFSLTEFAFTLVDINLVK